MSTEAAANIYTLMTDMTAALRDPNMIMLGGGSPALIDKAVDAFQEALIGLAQDRQRFIQTVCHYSDAAGDNGFRQHFAEYVNRQQGWDIGADNILITDGSQSAFALLFKVLVNDSQPVVFPMLPDYIGYNTLSAERMVGLVADIQRLGNHQFRYQLSAEYRDYLEQAAVLCLSRPTNPTGGMLADADLQQLLSDAKAQDVPVILDNAYGQPLPNIVFSQHQLPWASNAIYCLSLSKLGLPGVRTGIIIADADMVQRLARHNTELALAPGSIGPAIADVMLQSGTLEHLIQHVITPWYHTRSQAVGAMLDHYFADLPLRYHEADGGFFNWLFYDAALPLSGHALYQRLKAEQVVVVPGYAFAPGLREPWAHLETCFRISVGQPLEVIEEGIARIARVCATLS
jgi:valine--pyruvate aminotransferase